MTEQLENPTTNVYSFLPSHYKTGDRTFLNALLKAVNGSNAKLEQLIKSCIDQLFTATASGRYLIQLGEQSGFAMPQNSGLDIRAYRTLLPLMIADPKQVRQTIEEIIKAFYLSERVRPNLRSMALDPFVLLDGDDLIIETQSSQVQVSITVAQVNDINNVSSAELAAIINSSQSEILADAPFDRLSGKHYLRVTSQASGASANIRVLGGTLQNVLKFPKLRETLNTTNTTFNLTKTSPYSDELIFTWDGTGINPKLYDVKGKDIVTIRGFVNGIFPLSLINGSFEVVDSGYDYFVVRNDAYDSLTSSATQTIDNNIVFTSNETNTIYDKDEYALVSEVDVNTISITVPAVPPLAHRFLKGASHLRGFELQVLDFTRNSIQILLESEENKPIADNWFQLASHGARYNFRDKAYRTSLINNNPLQPTYSVASSDNQYSVLPFTTSTSIDFTDPFYGELDSGEYELSFGINHGLKYPWGFTLASGTGASNVQTADINKEQVVFSVINSEKIKVRLFDSSNELIKFEGIAWGPADLYQSSTNQDDGSDFYLQFPNSASAIASGLVPGTSFKLDPATGVDVNPVIAGVLRFRKMSVTSVIDNIVKISTGYGIGSFGLIITGTTGVRSGRFGGTPTYFFDKTSTYNQAKVLNGLVSLMYGYTPPVNSDFHNSYLYDPSGIKTKVTVSKYLVHNISKIFRGDNLTAIEVDTTTTVDGEKLPQSGNLILGYGTDKFEGPIRFYAVVENPGNNQILIDPAYRFKFTHDINSSVQVIHQASTFVPGTDGSDYPCYITGTAVARETMFLLMESLLASGIFLEKEVVKPSLRYDDTEITVFD